MANSQFRGKAGFVQSDNEACCARTRSPHRTNFNGQTNRRTKSSEHIDECVGTEEINTPPEDIADAQLNLRSLSDRLPPTLSAWINHLQSCGECLGVCYTETSTYSTWLLGGGMGRLSARRPSRWNSIASRIIVSVSWIVPPVATHPGRSGT